MCFKASLVPSSLPLFFVLWFAFRIMHGSGRAAKNGKVLAPLKDKCNTFSLAPPSAVRNVRVTEPVGNTTVEVHWDPPLSNGGRTDGFHYNIEYREVGNLGSWIRANEDRIRSNTYLIRGLKPVTRYIVRIIAGNNVSDQEPEIMGDRTTESVVKTTEGSKFLYCDIYICTLFSEFQKM